MDPVEQVVEVLQRLSEQSSPSSAGAACPISEEDVGSARRCLGLSSQDAEELGIWQAVGRSGLSMVAVAKALGDLISSPGPDAGIAASFYSCLLRLPGCPVSAPGLWVKGNWQATRQLKKK